MTTTDMEALNLSRSEDNVGRGKIQNVLQTLYQGPMLRIQITGTPRYVNTVFHHEPKVYVCRDLRKRQPSEPSIAPTQNHSNSTLY